MLNADLSEPCRKFIIAHWGKDMLKQIKERPVTWVRHEANPHLKHLRRKRKDLPLIRAEGSMNRILLQLSTEKKG